MTVAERSPDLRSVLPREDAAAMRAAVVQLRAHPGFPIALRTLLAGQLAILAASPAARDVSNDRGKFSLSLVALALHYTLDLRDPRSGLTGERLRRHCTELGLCSRGRVLSLILALKAAGHLEQAPASGDGRVRRLSPTPAMLGFHAALARVMFAATQLVMPEEAPVFAAVALPGDVPALCAANLDTLAGGQRRIDAGSRIAGLADTTAAIPILMDLTATGLAAGPGDRLPERPEVQLSISALSRRHGVSRKHVLKVLTLCENDGLLHRPVPGGDRVAVLPALIDDLADFAARTMLFTAWTAEVVVARRQGSRGL